MTEGGALLRVKPYHEPYTVQSRSMYSRVRLYSTVHTSHCAVSTSSCFLRLSREFCFSCSSLERQSRCPARLFELIRNLACTPRTRAVPYAPSRGGWGCLLYRLTASGHPEDALDHPADNHNKHVGSGSTKVAVGRAPQATAHPTPYLRCCRCAMSAPCSPR